MTKTTVTLTIDVDLIKKASQKKLNLSGTVNDLLKEFLAHSNKLEDLKNQREKAQKLLASLENKIAQVQESGE